jgi:hypothetical protein
MGFVSISESAARSSAGAVHPLSIVEAGTRGLK